MNFSQLGLLAVLDELPSASALTEVASLGLMPFHLYDFLRKPTTIMCPLRNDLMVSDIPGKHGIVNRSLVLNTPFLFLKMVIYPHIHDTVQMFLVFTHIVPDSKSKGGYFLVSNNFVFVFSLRLVLFSYFMAMTSCIDDIWLVFAWEGE
jgi:hypothetical protein